MLRALEHRGPDGSGWAAFSDAVDSERRARGALPPRVFDRPPWAVLGHVRLAILDRSERGLQPMEGQQGRWWVALNGEIYNYVELREELATLGHTFHTGTDTEVLLAGLEQWGQGCLPRLDGMFAFAAVDTRSRRVLLARDRFGEKPLYYRAESGELAFASEVPALLAWGGERRLDEDAAAGFLVHASSQPAGRSFIQGVQSLAPACALWVGGSGGATTSFRWYELAPATYVPASPGAAVEMVSTLMEQSVARRLRADVRVGSCLSGGLDSSTVVALARQLLPDGAPFHVFTAVPDCEADSEIVWARSVAEHLGVALHPVLVDASSLEGDLDRLVEVQGEPFTTLSMFNQFKVMEAAQREGVVVLLDGQGGDEVFLGYPRVFGVVIGQALRRGRLAQAARMWREASTHANLRLAEAARMVLLSYGPARRWARRGRMPHLAQATIRRAAEGEGMGANLHDLNRLQLMDNPLPALLRYEDRNAMAWAVETRLPFLSHELVEASLAIPPEWKIAGGFTKWPLRKVAEQLLPAAVAWRRDKMGFQAPTGRWLAQMGPRVSGLRSDCRSAALYHRLPWEDIRRGAVEERAAFRMVSLELWMRAFGVSA